MRTLQELLRATRESGSSDLHLASGSAPHVRLHGSLVPLAGGEQLSAQEMGALLVQGVNPVQWADYLTTGDLVQYFVAAQDTANNVATNPSAGAGGLTANPPAAATIS